MNLIGKIMRHKVFGSGPVAQQDEQSLTVDFPSGSKRLAYDKNTFSKFLTAEDPMIQEAILQEFEDIKKVQEQKRIEQAQQAAAVCGTAPRRRSIGEKIDELFAEDYHVAHLARQPILTYAQVEERFGIDIAGFGRGINPTPTTVVLISSISSSHGAFVYHDKWTADGDYIYSGEGRLGDQRMTRGNLAIKNAEQDGKTLHLFVKFSPQEYYYQGIFKLIDYTYENEKDEAGNIRKEYKFLLRKC